MPIKQVPVASERASKSPSSSVFKVVVMSGAQSVTTGNNTEAEKSNAPECTSRSSSSDIEIPLRKSSRARAGRHPNLHMSPAVAFIVRMFHVVCAGSGLNKVI